MQKRRRRTPQRPRTCSAMRRGTPCGIAGAFSDIKINRPLRLLFRRKSKGDEDVVGGIIDDARKRSKELSAHYAGAYRTSILLIAILVAAAVVLRAVATTQDVESMQPRANDSPPATA